MTRYGLCDDQWERIKGLIPGKQEMSVQPPKTIAGLSKRFSIAIAREFRAATCPSAWVAGRTHTDASAVGPRAGYAKSGVWQRVFEHLAADTDDDDAMIDST